MAKFNTGQSFADGDTVTGAKLNNITGLLDIYTGLISEQTAIAATVSTADQLLIADTDNGDSGAANRVTVQKLLNDTLTNGTFTNVNLTGNLNVAQLSTLGTLNNTRGTVGILNSTTGTIQSLTSSTANISQGSAIFTQGTIGTLNTTTGTIGTLDNTNGTIATLNSTTGTIGTLNNTTGTIATLNSTTGTIGNLSATTSTFLGTITGSTNVVNIGSGQIYKDASGNVGVGTTSPDGRLHVMTSSAGSVTADADADDLTIEGSGNTGLSILASGDDACSIYFGNPGGSGQKDGGIRYFQESFATVADRRSMTFITGTLERLRIDSSGNCSIGTATALSKLHVHGDLTMSNATTAVTAATGGVSKPATYAGFLTVSINGTSRKIPYYA